MDFFTIVSVVILGVMVLVYAAMVLWIELDKPKKRSVRSMAFAARYHRIH